MTEVEVEAGTGFLNDLGLSEVSSNVNTLPDGKYPGFVFAAKVVKKKDDRKALVCTFRVSEGSHTGKKIDDWKTLPRKDVNGNFVSEEDKKEASFLRMRIESLGFTEEQFATLKPADLVAIPVSFAVRTDGQYTNVKFVEVRKVDASQDFSTSFPSSNISDLM